MTKIPTPESKLIELSFEGECLKALQEFAYPDETGNEGQVKLDLNRMYGLTIKDELGEWSYIRPSEGSVIKTPALIEPDPDEFFFNRIKSLDKKFQDFILLNFHQGGMFYTARQFLTYHFNSLGFTPSSTEGQKHHITFDFTNSEELVVTENFSINALEFIVDKIIKVTAEKGKLSAIELENDKDKIFSFQESIIKSLGDKASSNYQQAKLQLEKNIETDMTRLSFNSDENISLIEFTVKHTVRLDQTSLNGIKVEELSKENINFKVQEKLYDLNFQTSNPEFSNLLSPNLQCVSSGFFAKSKFKNKIYELILSSYQNFIFILLSIIFKLTFAPVIIPEKTPFSAPAELSEARNNFSNRMRA